MTKLKKGDHIYVNRGFYDHHGLYVGNWQVIHYTKRDDDGAIIDITPLDEFAEGNEIWITKHNNPTYSRKERVQRAYSRLGEEGYNLIFNNCEHFVYWCFYGEKRSYQVRKALATTVVVGGTIEKLVRSGVLKTSASILASEAIASTVFSSAGTAAGIAAATITGGSVAGTAAGIAGASLAGGSATALATGVAAASLSTIAAPAVAAVAVGYGVKKLFDWIFD